MSRQLTLKQRRFIQEFIKDGNGTRAVRIAYPNIKTEKARGVMATRLIGNDKVREMIEEYLEKENLTPGVVMGKFVTIAAQAKYDRDKIAAWRNVAEIAGYTNKGPQVVVGQSQGIGDINETLEALRQLPEGYKEHRAGKDAEYLAYDKQSVVTLPENKQ